MSYLPSTTCIINDTPRSNLVKRVLKQSQRLRASMIQTILNQEPLSVNALHNIYNKELPGTIIGSLMHLINNPIEPIYNSTHVDRTKCLSNLDIYELTLRAKRFDNVCDCTTCQTYQNTLETKTLKFHDFKTNTCEYKLETRSNLACLKYVDTLKVNIHSIVLNKESNTKSYLNTRKVNATYFIEYSTPSDLVKGSTKTKVNTGVDINKVVRICSKKMIENAIYFKQISLHNINNINDVDLCRINLRFRICSRVPNQKSANDLGFANFNMASFHYTNNYTCSQQLPIILKENIPIVLGNLRVYIQLGYGKNYFGQEFIDYLNLHLDKRKLKNDIPLIAKKIKPLSSVRKNQILIGTRKNKLSDDDSKVSKSLIKKDSKMSVCVIPDKVTPNTLQKKILFGFIYISQAQYLENVSCSFLSCKPFGHEDLLVSRVITGTSSHLFNFQERIPYVYGEVLLNNLRNNSTVIEFWEQIDCHKKLIGQSTISLNQFYLAFRNPDVVTYLSRNKLPVIGSDWWESIVDANTKEIRGQAQILVALGTQKQIDALLVERGFSQFIVKILKYDVLKTTFQKTKNTTVSTLKNKRKYFLKRDIGVQNVPNNMDHKIKGIDNNTENELVHTSIINKKCTTIIANDHNDDHNGIRSTDVSDSTMQQNVCCAMGNMNSIHPTNNNPLILPNQNSPSIITFDAHVVIGKAMHLPTRRKYKAMKNVKEKFSKNVEEILLPSTYVTFETTPNIEPLVTHIVHKSDNPEWNWKADIKFPVNVLVNNQKRIIFKVWRKNNNAFLHADMDLDSIIGFASIDLTVLLSGLPSIEGWFNIVDFSNKRHGQINIMIKPLESLRKFIKCSSPTYKRESCQPTSNECDELMEIGQQADESLNRALKRKFIELDEITQRLRSRLSDVVGEGENVNVDFDRSNDAFSEQFDRDINTLCIEGAYDHIDFTREAKLVQLQQVSRALREIQSKEVDTNELVHSLSTNLKENNCSLSMEGTREGSNSSLRTDNTQTVPQPIYPLLLHDLDKELVQGKQRIDSLLKKLTLMSNSEVNAYVPGCSASDLEPSNTTLTDIYSLEASSPSMDPAKSGTDSDNTTQSVQSGNNS